MTIAELIASLDVVVLNTIDANVETPYTAIKLLSANQASLNKRLQSYLEGLQYAHISQVKPTLTELIDSEETVANEYVTLTRLSTAVENQYSYAVKSTIGKTLRSAIVYVNGALTYALIDVNEATQTITITFSLTNVENADVRITIL